MIWILAAIAGLWSVGRISRRSPHHPINSVPPQVARANIQAMPMQSSAQETAQISGGLVAGEDGGEG
jgi:hypothetical protein